MLFNSNISVIIAPATPVAFRRGTGTGTGTSVPDGSGFDGMK